MQTLQDFSAQRERQIAAAASPLVADMTTGAQRVVDKINEEHRLAYTAAATSQAEKARAIDHAIRCGQLLLEQKARLEHGDFQPWIEAHCRFAYSTAARYMTAARRISQGVEISSLTGLFPSGHADRARISNAETIKNPPASKTASAAAPVAPPTNVPPVAAELTLDRARAMLATDRKRFASILDAERDARRELTRAQAVHNNAVATVLAAAKKLGQSAAEAPARTPDAEPERADTPKTDWEPRGAHDLPESTALRFACEPIGLLGRIPPNDRLRDEALDDVVRWVKANR